MFVKNFSSRVKGKKKNKLRRKNCDLFGWTIIPTRMSRRRCAASQQLTSIMIHLWKLTKKKERIRKKQRKNHHFHIVPSTICRVCADRVSLWKINSHEKSRLSRVVGRWAAAARRCRREKGEKKPRWNSVKDCQCHNSSIHNWDLIKHIAHQAKKRSTRKISILTFLSHSLFSPPFALSSYLPPVSSSPLCTLHTSQAPYKLLSSVKTHTRASLLLRAGKSLPFTHCAQCKHIDFSLFLLRSALAQLFFFFAFLFGVVFWKMRQIIIKLTHNIVSVRKLIKGCHKK